MKADLYSTPANTRGSGALAHRTAAGFVVFSSADGNDVISLIDSQQAEANLVEQVVNAVGDGTPAAFAMLFTAGGDLYLVASGAVQVSLRSPSADIVVKPVAGQVLVQPLTAGINETSAVIRLHTIDIPPGATADTGLDAGTTEAEWVEILVGETVPAAVAPPAPADDEAVAAEPTAAAQVEPEASTGNEAGSVREPENTEESTEPALAVVEEPTAQQPSTPPPPPAPISDDVTEPAAPINAVENGPDGAAVMVLGVACSQGHHNHPDAVYCSQCGTKMGVHHTMVLLNGPRPPLGVLVVDDGTTYSLSEDLVIGREPSSHDTIIAGTASPMVLTDDTLSLSRQHARIVLEDWSVFAEDLNSSNGTFLSRSGQPDAWTQLQPHDRQSLEPGDRLRVGGRIIQVELHHVR